MMDIEKLIHCLQCCARVDAHNGGCDDCGLEYCGPECQQLCGTAAATLSTLQAENEKLREQVRQLETRARTERCDAADYDCRELGALRREVSSLREPLAAGEWIDPAVELPPDDDIVLAIVSGKPADNITLEDAYELASYGLEGWIIEQYELWETPTVTWWRPLPDPPEKKKEER